ncbi:hypothetical protein V6N13_048898 [Hibiscus sabdariffa]
MDWRSGNQTVTLFVNNLPPKLHWSGLNQSFGFHGDVVDAFIASKLDKSGKKFGFVRYNSRSSYWRKVKLIQRRSVRSAQEGTIGRAKGESTSESQ